MVQRGSPEIPFWPQLPGRSSAETSLRQFLGPAERYIESDDPARLVVRSGMGARLLDALDSADGALDTERAAGFVPFLEALRGGDFPRAWMVKAQITGPVSLGVCMSDLGGPILRDSAALRILTDYVARQSAWQVARLATAGLPVLLVVDEPCLAIASTMPGGAGPAIDAVASVLSRARASGARVCLHCCARVPPALLCHPEPDVISFDASTQLEPVLASAAVRSFLERDGWLSAGLVPTTRVVSRGIAGMLFARWLMAASRRADVPRLARQTIVTATCGLGLLPPAAAIASFRAAGHLGARMRRVAAYRRA